MSIADDNTPLAALGLSFDGTDIHYAEVLREAQSLRVRSIGSVKTALKFGTGIEGVEKSIQEIYPYLNGCVEDNEMMARQMCLSLNSHLATIQKIQVDTDSNDEDFRNHVRWEFSQWVHGDPDDFMVNTCDTRAGGGFLSSVLVVGIRRRFAETLSQVLEKFRVNFSCLDVDILCAHATYELNHERCMTGMTALLEVRSGIATVLLCNDYDPQYVYQFPTTTKGTTARVAEFLGPYLDNMIHMYGHDIGKEAVLGRTVVCGPMAIEIAQHLDAKYKAEPIRPFGRVKLDPKYEVRDEPEDEASGQKSKVKVERIDYTPYAECIGAAVKLLAN